MSSVTKAIMWKASGFLIWQCLQKISMLSMPFRNLWETDDWMQTENAGWMLAKMLELTDGDLGKIHSVTTDNCSLERATCDRLSQDPRLSHIFHVPCDSCGLSIKTCCLRQEWSQPFIKAWLLSISFAKLNTNLVFYAGIKLSTMEGRGLILPQPFSVRVLSLQC